MVIPNTPYDTATPNLVRARPACASAGARGAQAAAGEQGEAGRASPRSAREALLAASGGAELYAALLCRFEPAGVLPFLQARPRCPAASRPPPGVVSAAVAACEADALSSARRSARRCCSASSPPARSPAGAAAWPSPPLRPRAPLPSLPSAAVPGAAHALCAQNGSCGPWRRECRACCLLARQVAGSAPAQTARLRTQPAQPEHACPARGCQGRVSG